MAMETPMAMPQQIPAVFPMGNPTTMSSDRQGALENSQTELEGARMALSAAELKAAMRRSDPPWGPGMLW